MVIVLLIFGSVICVLGYRSLATLLRQIPDRNEDFDAFFLEHRQLDRVSSMTANSTRNARHLKKEVAAGNGVSAIRTGSPGLKQ